MNPTLNIGGLSNNGAVPKSNIGAGLSIQQPNPNNPLAGTSLDPQPGSLSGMINIPKTPAPTTPVKSTTVTHPSGTTIATTYHAPATNTKTSTSSGTQYAGGLAPDDPSNKYNTQTGLLNSNYKDPNVSQQIQNGVINSSTGINANNSIEYPNYAPPNQGTTGVSQGGLIGNAIGQSTTPNAGATTATTNLNNFSTASDPELDYWNKQISDLKATQGNAMKNIDSSGVDQSLATGQEAILNRNYATQLEAAQSGLQNALAKRGQNITAATSAGNIGNTTQGLQQGALANALGANAPITGVPYGTQNINPSTGQPYGSTGGVSVDPNNPVSSIPNLADAVINGRMTIDQANSALGNNIGMTTNLRSQIMTKNPSFNFTQSSASAATQAIGQQVNTFATSANSALDKLTSDFASLPDWQKSGIPGTIGIEQAIGKFFGNDKLATYQTTLHDARAQLSGVLATAGGMTPTSAGDTAQTYLPDNMTRDQLPAKIAAAKALVAQKVQAFQQSGVQNGSINNNTSGGSGGTYAEAW